jgi:hypothetical protein
MQRIDLTGQRFGRLTVVEHAGIDKWVQMIWRCICDCGGSSVVPGGILRRGHTKSCGCRQISGLDPNASRKHGHGTRGRLSPTYISWQAMLQRCRDPNSSNWKYYGGRGISVCKRWLDFKAFLADVGTRPVGTSIDRIDADGNYEPGNVRWADAMTQRRNRRR